MNEFTEKFENEFSFVSLDSCTGIIVYEEARTWIIDYGSSRHMTGIWGVFLNISKIGLGHCIESGVEIVLQ